MRRAVKSRNPCLRRLDEDDLDGGMAELAWERWANSRARQRLRHRHTREQILRARSAAVRRARRYVRIIERRFGDRRGEMDDSVRRYVLDRVPCSCPMCGNERRHFGVLSRQHRRVVDAEQAEE